MLKVSAISALNSEFQRMTLGVVGPEERRLLIPSLQDCWPVIGTNVYEILNISINYRVSLNTPSTNA